MRTPAGTECPHFYEDFHRGRQQQECRLVLRNPRSLPWSADVCSKCTVPAILRANGSEALLLEVTVGKRLGRRKAVSVSASCLRHDVAIDNPYVGCAACRDEIAGSFTL